MHNVTPRVLGLRDPCDCGCRPAHQLINQSALSVTIDGITLSGKASFSGCASILVLLPSHVFI
jgi:hypothetical protein